MCLAQGPQRSDAGEAQTHGPSVLSQALYHSTQCQAIIFDRSAVSLRLYIDYVDKINRV